MMTQKTFHAVCFAKWDPAGTCDHTGPEASTYIKALKAAEGEGWEIDGNWNAICPAHREALEGSIGNSKGGERC
jgi:hypothetical protein